MPIFKDAYKTTSLSLLGDFDAALASELEAMDEEERSIFYGALENLDLEALLAAHEYDREMVDVETWLNDPYFMGEITSNLYPLWRDDLIELFGTGLYSQAVITGSTGTGKSFFSHLVILRMIYEASCLKDPARSYGLASGSVIGFCTIASSKETARRVVFEGISAKMKESYYFREVFAPKRETKDEIVFPKNLQIIAGSSTDTSIIGMNIFGGIFDEGNFVRTSSTYGNSAMLSSHVRARNYQKAMRLYTSVVRRMKSRFNRNGKLPGILCVLSSKTTNDSFTENIINKAIADDEKAMFVRDRSLVDVKRDQFSKETFKVLVGNESYTSRILAADEDLTQFDRRSLIIDVPVDLIQDFQNNMDEALRDLMGVSTVAISSFMSRVDKVERAKDPTRSHPFVCPLYAVTSEWDSRLPYRIHWSKVARQRENGEWEPLRHPDRPRFVGLDPSSTGDGYGLAIGHAGDAVPVTQQGADGLEVVELLPTVETDFVLRIKGTPGEEILFKNVRKLMYEFAAHGFHLMLTATDQYQSREMIQALESQGYRAELASVDTSKEPYRLLRALIYDGRWSCYDYPVLFHELKGLEEGPTKIDHRPDGCFVGETRIPLLDGSTPTMAELEGREVWIYSSRPDGTMVPGRARGRRTKQVTQVVDVILDSGAVARCTPEHRWMLFDGTYKAAKDIVPHVDRLMPIRFYHNVDGGYLHFANGRRMNESGSTVAVHRQVAAHALGGWLAVEGRLIHHVNGVKTDNRPENLEAALPADHARHHAAARHRSDAAYTRKVAAGLQAFNYSEAGRRKHAEAIRRTVASRSAAQRRAAVEKRAFFRSDVTVERLVKAGNAGAASANAAAKALGCGRNVIVRVLKDHGFIDWRSFYVARCGENHRAVAVIPVVLDAPVWVYDLEVDEWDNFALAAGVFVHNSKDVSDAVCQMTWQVMKHALGRAPNLPERGLSVPAPGTVVRSLDPGVAADMAEAAAERARTGEPEPPQPEDGRVRQIPRSLPPSYNRRRSDGRVEDMRQKAAVFDPEEFLVRG